VTDPTGPHERNKKMTLASFAPYSCANNSKAVKELALDTFQFPFIGFFIK